MQNRVVVIFVFAIVAAFFLSFRHVESKKLPDFPIEPQSMKAYAFAVSPSVDSIARPSFRRSEKNGSQIGVKQVNDDDEQQVPISTPVGQHDNDNSIASFSAVPMPTPSLSFDGISNLDNVDLYGLFYIPPDPTGDVGPHHYVQAVNAAIRIFDKDGNSLTPPFKLSDLLAPLATPCSTRNDGDPTVVYDPLADRWIISEFCTAFPPFRQMIAISKTSDPTGQYFIYEFVMPNVRLNDYPKLAVWSDGYYMSTDEFFGSDYVGSGAFAFDRTKMLSGDPRATYIYFHLPQPPPNRLGGILPSDLDGLTPPPPNAPDIFAGYSATEYGDPIDGIRLFDFHADFDNPSLSTFLERPESPITVTAFDPTSPDGRADIAQPPPGEWLDSISDRLMYRVAYRNFVDHQSLVFNQTVRLTPVTETYRAGVRVYELRSSAGGPFAPAEQTTIGDDSSSRWLGSAAEDNGGNIAVAYSFSNEAKRPAILYTGKLADDPRGMFRSEATLIAGTGVQKAFGFRWGDYSGISVDPADDCTFWVTNEYFTQESQDFSDFAWLTRIAKFKFPECTSVPKATIAGSVMNASTLQAVDGAVVTAAAYSRVTNANGKYGGLVVIPGHYLLTVSAPGFKTQTVSVDVADGETIVRDFVLVPIPVIVETSMTFSTESCSVDQAPEPGEAATVSLAIHNVGKTAASNLVVALMPSTAISASGPAQRYGSLQVGGASISRPFTFTVMPDIRCGSEFDLVFSLTDGSNQIGTISVPMHAGAVRYSLKEAFDQRRNTRLPAGWTSSSTGGQQPWILSRKRSISDAFSIFSPDPNQIGLNELVSPSIPITSRQARLTFRNWYDLETTFLRNQLYDGSVLEISVDGGAWQDILTAGGSFESGGYDGVIDSCCQNPLAGHMGWSGKSGPNQLSEFITTSVRLPSSVSGHSVRIRWRVGTDIGTFREGQYIDDVEVSDGYSCSCTINGPYAGHGE